MSRHCGCRSSAGILKTLYPHKRHAIAARDTARNRAILRREPPPRLWVYPCPHGDGWHVTHHRPAWLDNPGTDTAA